MSVTHLVPCRLAAKHILASPGRATGGATWLDQVLTDQSSGPRLYAWTGENLAKTTSVPPGPPSPSSSQCSRRIHVLGIGNLGRLYAAELAKLPDTPLTLVLHRKSLLEQWHSNPGIELSRQGRIEKTTDVDVEWWTDEKPAWGPIREVCHGGTLSNLIVATKAPDALPEADRLRSYLDARSTVVFVQNGMSKLWPPHGPEYCAARYRPGQHPNWAVAITTHGVISTGVFKSIHASPADVAIGPVLWNPLTQAHSENLLERIGAAPNLVAGRVSRLALWGLQLEKVVVNSIINPLTAVLGCRNGHLFADAQGPVTQIMDVLIAEASDILQALVRAKSSLEVLCESEDVEATRQAWLERFSATRLRQMIHDVGDKVKDNISSMLQDVMAGRKTEISEFNGWLLEKAAFLDLEAPNHARLLNLVESGALLCETELAEQMLPTAR